MGEAISTQQKLKNLEGSRQYWLGRIQHSGGHELDQKSLRVIEAIIEDVKALAAQRGEQL